MLPRSPKNKRVHPDCPDEVRRQVDVVLAVTFANRSVEVFAGETMSDLVRRLCPEVFVGPAAHGFELRFDLEENKNLRYALSKGRLDYQIRRKVNA